MKQKAVLALCTLAVGLLLGEGWRSLLVKQCADALELPVLDTRGIFQAAANAAAAAALTEALHSD